MFEYGDEVRHGARPEWGCGSIVKVESTCIEGVPDQRVTVRFPAHGAKTFIASEAPLDRVNETSPIAAIVEQGSSIDAWDRMGAQEGLGELASRKIDEVMTGLPQSCRDPFRSLDARLATTIDLYRFDESGRGLIEWAVAQTRLDDPLSRFNRHELESHFKRWACQRDQHLVALLQEFGRPTPSIQAAINAAPRTVRNVLQRAGLRAGR